MRHLGEPITLELMSKPKARSTLYRLIEAGQLVRKALVVPLHERGLEAGDDAILFVLHNQLGASEADLAEELGASAEQLHPRLERLAERELIQRKAVGPELAPGFALTERGERIRDLLADNWDELESALLGDLGKKKQKVFRKALARVVELLKL